MVTFFLLITTVLFAWHPRLKIMGIIGFCLFLGSGLYFDNLSVLAVISALTLAVLIGLSRHENKIIRCINATLMTFLTLLLYMHKVPGFHNLKVWHAIRISENSAPVTMFLNFDKPLFGVLYLLFFADELTFHGRFRDFFSWVVKSIIPLLSLIIPLGLAIKFIAFDPKITAHYPLWAVNNLLLVCVGEELFFRGYVQRGLCTVLSKSIFGWWLGVGITSVLFGAAHFSGDVGYVVLATISGFFYGLAYAKTKTIEASIIVHFILNSIHFLLFSYPYFLPAS